MDIQLEKGELIIENDGKIAKINLGERKLYMNRRGGKNFKEYTDFKSFCKFFSVVEINNKIEETKDDSLSWVAILFYDITYSYRNWHSESALNEFFLYPVTTGKMSDEDKARAMASFLGEKRHDYSYTRDISRPFCKKLAKIPTAVRGVKFLVCDDIVLELLSDIMDKYKDLPKRFFYWFNPSAIGTILKNMINNGVPAKKAKSRLIRYFFVEKIDSINMIDVAVCNFLNLRKYIPDTDITPKYILSENGKAVVRIRKEKEKEAEKYIKAASEKIFIKGETVCGWEFNSPSSTEELRNLGKIANNCIGGYGMSIKDGGSVVYATKGDEIVCGFISEYRSVTILGKSNKNIHGTPIYRAMRRILNSINSGGMEVKDVEIILSE